VPALLLPIAPLWRKQHEASATNYCVEPRAFVVRFVSIPCQVVLTARRITMRVFA
jgi:hypothetical protein